MVTTTEIIPKDLMKPFVRCYSLREFDTSGIDVLKPLSAQPEFYLAFHLNTDAKALGSYYTQGKETNYDMINAGGVHVLGLQSQPFGNAIFSGHIRLFSIQFTPAGFYTIFNISPAIFVGYITGAREIMGDACLQLRDALSHANDAMEMATLAEAFLIRQLARQRNNPLNTHMQSISNIVFQQHGFTNMQQLAFQAHMSKKTFERKFTEQVGLTPKLFARVVRFSNAVMLKMLHESESWTSISHQLGYFDQNHFIKDFRAFAGISPSALFNNTPPPKENFIIRPHY